MSKSSNFTKFNCFLSSLDGELYAGVYVDFMGTDSAIFRTLGTKTAMRTDQYNSRWLNGNIVFSPMNFTFMYLFYNLFVHKTKG